MRHQGSDYLCRQCWQVISGQPWPELAEASAGAPHSASPPSPGQSGRPPLDRRQQQQLQQLQQQQQQMQQQGSPLSMDMLQRSTSAPMSGMTAQQALHFTYQQQQQQIQQQQQQQQQYQQQLQQQQQQQQQPFGMPQQPVLGRRSQSFQELQLQQQRQQQGGGSGMPISHQQQRRGGSGGWQPASMPEQAALLGGSAEDPRWGNLAVSASDHRRERGRPGSQRQYLGASAPVRAGLLSGSMAPQFNPREVSSWAAAACALSCAAPAVSAGWSAPPPC